MLSQEGGSDDVVKAAAQVESMPGGAELLYTVAAEEMMKAQGLSKKKAEKIRLYQMGGEVKAARGGSTKVAAERTRKAGRGDDSILLHVSPEEAEALSAMWGKPEINPDTGIGEYGFLSKVWKKVKKGVKKVVKSRAFQIIAPIALSVFAPGIGTAIGMQMGLSGAAASVAGNAVVQGGLGAVSGGKKGAIAGAISGGLGAAAGAYGTKVGQAVGLKGKAANTVGSALIHGGGQQLTGGDFTSGAIQGGLGALAQPAQDRFVTDTRQMMGLEEGLTAPQVMGDDLTMQGAPAMSPTLDRPLTAAETLSAAPPGGDAPRTQATSSPITASASAKPSAWDFAKKWAVPGLVTLGALASSQGRKDEPPPNWQQPDDNFNEPLPIYTMNRQFQGLPNAEDYYTYGQVGSPQSGQHLFITPPDPFGSAPPAPGTGGPNPGVPQQPRGGLDLGGSGLGRVPYEYGGDVAAPGGMPTGNRDEGHHVMGPGSGRSDDIPAKLSDGEYVIDAESVALLGDGSGSAGARRLDDMRKNLRKHKAKNLSKGTFSHKAKSPEGYMRNVRKLKRKVNYEHGGLHNVARGGAI